MIPHLLSAGWGRRVFCALAVFFFFFVKQALANRVDGTKGVQNSEATNLPACLRFRKGLKHHSHATL